MQLFSLNYLHQLTDIVAQCHMLEKSFCDGYTLQSLNMSLVFLFMTSLVSKANWTSWSHHCSD